MTATLDRTLSLPELAHAWGWSQSKLRRLCDAQAIPHLFIRGRYYFKLREVTEWEQAAHRAVHHRAGREEAAAVRRLSHAEECRQLGIEVEHDFT